MLPNSRRGLFYPPSDQMDDSTSTSPSMPGMNSSVSNPYSQDDMEYKSAANRYLTALQPYEPSRGRRILAAIAGGLTALGDPKQGAQTVDQILYAPRDRNLKDSGTAFNIASQIHTLNRQNELDDVNRQNIQSEMKLRGVQGDVLQNPPAKPDTTTSADEMWLSGFKRQYGRDPTADEVQKHQHPDPTDTSMTPVEIFDPSDTTGKAKITANYDSVHGVYKRQGTGEVIPNAKRYVASEAQEPTIEDAQGAAEDILAHRMAPSQMSTMYGGFGAAAQKFKRMVIAEARKKQPDFNYEEAEAEYQFSKSPGLQNVVRNMDSVTESMPLVIERAKTLANGKVKSINALINAGKNQFNNVDLRKFQTDSLFVADEIAKILQGGGTGSATSDSKLAQAQKIIQTSDDPSVVAGVLADVSQLIGYRRMSLTRGTYMGPQQSTSTGSSPPNSTAPSKRRVIDLTK